MEFEAFLDEIRDRPDYAGQMVYVREQPAREPRFAQPQTTLSLPVRSVLAAQGVERLYSHQARALEAVAAGQDVLIATGTASGKSLCYRLPLLDVLASDPRATALLLFPTKALCQDQYQLFATALGQAGITGRLAGVFDGDSPDTLRRRLRDEGSVLFTNPDMVHAALMPAHPRWSRFLSNLKLLVLDELHVYNGIFGSNMGNLLRRLFRLCEHYGSRPQIVACSATIGNPAELAFALTGRRPVLIDEDGSPRGKRTYVFWNPPRVRATRCRSRRSANVEAHELMAMLVQRGVSTITFSKAKMTAEMIHRYVCDKLREMAPQLVSKVSPYRGGYLPEERRQIERQLFSGQLLGVSTTAALELGIDVGSLDASIVVGYPGTLASFFQQTGRAGRRDRDALAILVGLDTSINQYVMNRPEYIFGRPVEEAVIDADNPFVITGHLRCAAHELPLPDREAGQFGPHAPLVLRILEENRKLKHINGTWFHAAAETPQHEVSLRASSDANVVIRDVDSGAILGEVDVFDAPPILHPEAIYMHRGDTYRVLTLDMDRHIATVKREEVDYYTQALGGTDIHHIDHQLREKPFGTGTAYWGEVTAHFRNEMYEKIQFYTLDAVSRHGLDLPTLVLETMAFWIVPPESLMERVRKSGLDAHSGLRGIGYATRMLLPLFITCDTADFSHSIGAVNAPWNAVFVYERFPLGLGFTGKAYDRLHEIMPAVLDAIRKCPCETGCPCCVGKPLRNYTVWNVERGEGSIPSKQAAVMILEGMLGDLRHLENPDRSSLADSPAAEEQRLEQAVRRRLERMREPEINHPIDPKPRTEYPTVEQPATLEQADVGRRAERRRNFEKDLRKRLAQKMAGRKPSARKIETQPAATAPVVRPKIVPPLAIELGDSLAARARRMKKGKPAGP